MFMSNDPIIIVMVQAHQVMKCVVCCPSNQTSSSTSTTSLGRVFFFSLLHMISLTWKIMLLMSMLHFNLIERTKACWNGYHKWEVERKEKEGDGTYNHYWVLFNQDPYKPNDLNQQWFIEILVLFIAKGYMLMPIVKNSWLPCLVMQQCDRLKFPSCKQLVQ
jgi:hypothetical protein